MNRIRRTSRAPPRLWDGSSPSPKGRGDGLGRSRKVCLLSTALTVVVLLSIYSIRLGRLHPHPDLAAATPEDLELVAAQQLEQQRQRQEQAAAEQAEGGALAAAAKSRLHYFRPGQAAQAGGDAFFDAVGVAPGIPSVPRHYDDIHIVFSTDCSDYQNWQSLLFFYSAARAGQKGPVTRLASGCTEAQMAELRDVHALMPHRHRIHFTPDFSLDARTGRRYPYYNKPRALRHWLSHASPPVAEAVIALLDPDMAMLRPLRPYVDDDPETFPRRRGGPGQPPVRGVEPWITEGHPAGQLYALGGAWAKWPDLAAIVGSTTSPALSVPLDQAAKHYPVGPPYLAHVRDMAALADKWVEFVARTYEGHPGILSEMYAFCIAAAHLRLPHHVIRSYMVSDPNNRDEDAPWALVEALSDEDVCRALGPPLDALPASAPIPTLPVVAHYCHVFRAGLYMFGKRRRGLHGVFACDAQYFAEPPPHAGELRVKVHPPDRVEQVTRRTAVRNAFMVCALTRLLNEALLDFRQARCSAEEFAAGLSRVRPLTDLSPAVLADAERWAAEGAS